MIYGSVCSGIEAATCGVGAARLEACVVFRNRTLSEFSIRTALPKNSKLGRHDKNT